MKRFNWGWGITIVYTVFALATLSFVFFAMTQEVDLVRDDYYEYSLTLDQRIEAQNNARKLGDAVGIERGESVIHIHIPVEHLNGYEGEVHLYRASLNHSDVTMKLKADTTGTHVIATKELAPGPWKVTATWKVNDVVYEIIRTLEI